MRLAGSRTSSAGRAGRTGIARSNAWASAPRRHARETARAALILASGAAVSSTVRQAAAIELKTLFAGRIEGRCVRQIGIRRIRLGRGVRLRFDRIIGVALNLAMRRDLAGRPW